MYTQLDVLDTINAYNYLAVNSKFIVEDVMTASVTSAQTLPESVRPNMGLVLISSIASVILGLMLSFSPGITTVVLVQFMAAFLFGSVISNSASAFSN